MKKSKLITVLTLSVIMVLLLSTICFAASSTLKIDMTAYPKTIEEGKSFGLRGKITSNCKITTVLGVIYNENGKEVFETKDTPNAKSMDVKPANLNQKLPFNKLKAGLYKLTVIAKDENGGYVRFDKGFTVKGKNEDKTPDPKPEKSTLKISLTQHPSTINEGESFGLRGNVTSNYKITNVTGVITDSKGKKVMSTTDKPNAKSMDIRPANLNQKMEFSKLEAGKYTMTVTAKDEGGGKDEFDFSFTVKGKTKTVTLSYNLNGGSGSCPDQSVEAGSKVKIEAKNPARDGYDFLGWAETKSGKAEYDNGDKITVSKDTTLYAVWKKKEQPKQSSDLETFNKTESKVNAWFIVDEESTNKGTPLRSAPASGDNIVGYVKKQQAIYVVSKGKNSEGNLWYKLENGSFIYSDRVHEGKLFTVTYVAADAKNIPAEGKLPESVAASISKQTPTKKGYKFLGWTTDSAAKTVKYAAGDKVTAYSNMRLYAVWEKLPDATNLETFNRTKTAVNKWYIITEESTAQGTPLRNAPENAEATKTGKFVKKNESVYVTAKGQNNAGNIWYQLKDGSFIYSERVREAKNLTIIYDANGGSGAPAKQTVTEGVKVKLSTVKPTMVKHKVVGWTTNKAAKKAEYASGAEIIPTKDIKLYAVWEEFSIEDMLAAEYGVPQAKSTDGTGYCTLASTATIIRRKQILEGKEPSFTMSDIIMSSTNPKDPIEKRREKSKLVRIDPANYNKKGVMTRGPEEIYNGIAFDPDGYNDKGFSNCYSGDGSQKYYIKRITVNSVAKSVEARKNYIINLLKDHPEGIYIYVRYNVSKDWKHGLVITSYDEKTKTFYSLDPVDVRDGLRTPEDLRMAWISGKDACGSVDNVFKNLTTTGIRYIK